MKLVELRPQKFDFGKEKGQEIRNFHTWFIRNLTFEQSDERHMVFTMINQIDEKVYELDKHYRK